MLIAAFADIIIPSICLQDRAQLRKVVDRRTFVRLLEWEDAKGIPIYYHIVFKEVC